MATKRNWKVVPALICLAFVFALGGLTLPVTSLMSQSISSQPVMTQFAGLTAGQMMEHRMYLEHNYHVECIRDGKVVWVENFKNRVTTVGLNQYLNATLGNVVAANNQIWYVGLVGPTQTDGKCNSASNFLTSVAGAFSASDVGQPVTIQGAGAAGADLTTTIGTYTSATNVSLAVNASTTVTTSGYLIGARLADTMASHAPWVEVGPYSNATRVLWVPGAASSGSMNNTSPAAFAVNATNTIYGAFMCNAGAINGATGTLLGMGPFSASRSVLSGDTLNVTVTCSIQ
jgi:hypothetical protein